MITHSLRSAVLLLAAFVSIQSCVPSTKKIYLSTADRPGQVVSFFDDLDRLVKKKSKQNVVYARIPDFPYLRTDRFLAEMKNRLMSDSMRNDWVKYLRKKDLEARRSEISALSQQEIEMLFKKNDLSGPATHGNLYDHFREKSEIFYQNDKNRPNYIEALIESVKVPDDYSTAMRTFGLYPLAYLPVAYFSNRAFDKIRDWHQLSLDAFENQGHLVSYRAESQDSNEDVSKLLSSAEFDSFGLPILSPEEVKKIAQAFAPIILQDTAGQYDRVGSFEWIGTQPKLNTGSAAVYYYLTYGLVSEKPVIQINYSFWYTAREGELAPWFERGEFDGITIRYSLSRTGSPIMLDIMNNCGCYHFFVPSADTIQSVREKDFEIDPLVPKWLPDFDVSTPMLFRVNSGWHQIEYMAPTKAPIDAITYRLIPYENLESLPTNQKYTVNLFDKEGIMKGSYRIEPYIFFSMGIPKVGYMRQRGHHPIKMIGREHFDNPLLFDRNFIYKKNSDN